MEATCLPWLYWIAVIQRVKTIDAAQWEPSALRAGFIWQMLLFALIESQAASVWLIVVLDSNAELP